MNYLKIYNQIIEKRKLEKPIGYKERHHIIPRCLNGSNKSENLIDLTAREHFICHLLLVKIHKNDKYYYKLLNAFMLMSCKSKNQKRYYNSRLYEYLRKDIGRLMSYLNTGYENSNFGNIWMHNKKLKISKPIKKEQVSEYLLDGWEIGRILDWNLHNTLAKKKEQNKIKRRLELEDKIKLYSEYYKLYDQYGWDKFKQITNYDKTKQCLVMRFAKYVKEFVPQNGKKRGKIDL